MISCNSGNRARQVKEAVIMRGTGHTYQEIGDKVGVSGSTVGNWLKKLKEESLEKGVDETLTRIFLEADPSLAVPGLISLQINNDLEWWLNHYKTNAHWLILRMWQLCNEEGEQLESIKKICNASLPAFCESYQFDLEKYLKMKEMK
tara:strand:+ start:654 stop:1094 length:441 start_codon:yes stop_codon:yes gene_type:complete